MAEFIDCSGSLPTVEFSTLEEAYDHFLANRVWPYISSHPRHYRSVKYMNGEDLLNRFKCQIRLKDTTTKMETESTELLEDLLRNNPPDLTLKFAQMSLSV